MRTIALEEHFATAELAASRAAGGGALWPPGTRDLLLDLGKGRLADMDAAGIDVQVISHAAPGAQQLGAAGAVAAARNANDQLAAAVASHPDRFAGFATLPTGDPAAAADELERAVGDLGLVGAMIHSTLGTNGAFLDDGRFEPLLGRFERLDVPLYLHPGPPPAALRETLFGGLPDALAVRLATNAWGWHAEAGLHALRMVTAGVFDRHPGLRMIIGHGGEMIPFMLDRIDRTLHGLTRLELPPSGYFLRNIWVTTSGMFSLPPVMCAVQVLGVDRVLFSVDYPFGPNQAGRKLLDMLPLSPADRAKIAGGNAQRVLGIELTGPQSAVLSFPAASRNAQAASSVRLTRNRARAQLRGGPSASTHVRDRARADSGDVCITREGTWRKDADMTIPVIAAMPDHGHPDSGDPAEAAARKRMAEARAWQLCAQLMGDLCEYRSATAALQRAHDEVMRATTVADAR